MKVLILTGNNALSHLTKGLSLAEELETRGHVTTLSVARERSSFLSELDIPHRILPDIQETNHSSSPSFGWFRPDVFEKVVRAEIELMKEVEPDVVIGVFRFTSCVSSRYCHLPYFSLTCGCMLPGSGLVLGYESDETGAAEQQASLDFFYTFGAQSIGSALKTLGYPPIFDIRELLRGDQTILWDFPEFTPIEHLPEVVYAGPLSWRGWSRVTDPCCFADLGDDIVLVSFGTGKVPSLASLRIVEALGCDNREVVVAAGGQTDLMESLAAHRHVHVFRFAPMGELIERSSIVVCHGGQQTLFEALAQGVPAAVIPFQPEQAHNGRCLEKLGVGGTITPTTCFKGSPFAYIQALEKMDQTEIGNKVREIERRALQSGGLDLVRDAIGGYRGAASVIDILEESCGGDG